MHDTILEPVTVTVSAAIKYSGLGRTKLYELLSKGEIESVRVTRAGHHIVAPATSHRPIARAPPICANIRIPHA